MTHRTHLLAPLSFLGLLALASAVATPAHATGFTDYGYDILSSTETRFDIDGAFRLRGESLFNLDLDRGPTPSGDLFFPVSPSDPARQWFFGGDMRLRTDLAMYAPGGVVAVKARIDVLDNLAFGDNADGIPGASLTQMAPSDAFRIKRAWGEIITPVGYFAAGRMGHHWGLGMLGNGGDCPDCDSGDAADRVAFITLALKHIFAVAYDFSSTGFLVDRVDGVRKVDVEPTAAVRTLSFAVLHWRDDAARKRRRLAGKPTFEWGLYYGYRWQGDDLPSTYLTDGTGGITSSHLMHRGLSAHVFDLWHRTTHPMFRIELETALMVSSIEQSSLMPGLLLPEPTESLQIGAALETDFGPPEGFFVGGVDLGYASGDPAPGFGAKDPLDTRATSLPGDLDGPQALPPGDYRIDNFRFHPDYRVDRILFREIVGTVTDAFYVRPHGRLRLLDFGSARLDFATSAVVSFTTYRATAPGGEQPLGVEIDPTLRYHSDDGFAAALEYAVLFPLSGLDNVELGMPAKPAQLIRVHLAFGF